ncbi:MAG: hypothetical protein IPL95_05960 [Saprospiraceae bacterium]|nr:hypothetical protein [Saprospiraceae bacterium]
MHIKLQIIFSFFIFHGVVFQSVAQKHDYNWLLADGVLSIDSFLEV